MFPIKHYDLLCFHLGLSLLISILEMKTGMCISSSLAISSETAQNGICNSGGKFWQQTELFTDEKKMREFMQLRKISTAAYCFDTNTKIPGFDLSLAREFECFCDARYAHLATGEFEACANASEVGLGPADEKIDCAFSYTKQDEKNFSCLKENLLDFSFNERKKSTELSDESKSILGLLENEALIRVAEKFELNCIPSGPPEAMLCLNEICKFLFRGLITFACSAINTTEGKDHYEIEGHKIFPTDICAIDCYIYHGANIPPYGECRVTLEGELFCFCYFNRKF